MRQIIVVAGIALGCAGCALPQPAEPELTQVTTSVAPDNPNCILYSAQTVGQTGPTILGRACRQADGSWQLTEGPPGQPAQYALTYWPPPDSDAGLYEPWLWGPPIGFSIGAVVFVDRDHHLHHFRDFAEFANLHHHHFGHFEPGAGIHHG